MWTLRIIDEKRIMKNHFFKTSKIVIFFIDLKKITNTFNFLLFSGFLIILQYCIGSVVLWLS